MKNIVAMMTLACMLAVADVQAQDSVELEGTTITGNRELPKVLYIVPWKNSDPNNVLQRPAAGLVDEILSPVDRDVFRRQVEYYEFIEDSGSAEQ